MLGAADSVIFVRSLKIGRADLLRKLRYISSRYFTEKKQDGLSHFISTFHNRNRWCRPSKNRNKEASLICNKRLPSKITKDLNKNQLV